MALPNDMDFDLSEALKWEDRLRVIATDLEAKGLDSEAKMMFAAAHLMGEAAHDLAVEHAEQEKYRS